MKWRHLITITALIGVGTWRLVRVADQAPVDMAVLGVRG
jgi:hypothetical protein